ncbi:Bug family tripartite tricarboxylate transporter substrate binding protein [Vreelandella malpeensis]|uniref:Tripartite tricarboxylate transporter substrate binding protein n=1 Tax=Vreelandella malpeensis TaxID=1172368 RepID=A0ABS8DS88_9GAMM|nr:tripartite tricarboxylate transporter substrate binding protein [Halomonas malpeensis]MCB8889181.1 tripartite tricarboxylate transporter substrate binding protein [Halomonas malpeensis]
MTLRRLLLTSTLGLSLSAGAFAADFPDRALTLVVPWPAGGAYDLAARLMAEHANDYLGAPLVVQNVTGAAGSTGVRQVAEADADGYTLGMMGTHAIAQSYMNPNATPLEALDPLVFIGPEPAALAVASDTGITDIAAYLQALQETPGSIINGNDSPGGFSYIAASMLESQFDVSLTKIPYQGYSPTVSALLSGEVMSALLPIPLLADQHAAGQLTLLGVAADARHPFAPEVPTFKEQGYDFVAEDFFMLYLPNGVSDERREALASMFYSLLEDDAFQAAASEVGLVIAPRPQQATATYLSQRADEVYTLLEAAHLVDASLAR